MNRAPFPKSVLSFCFALAFAGAAHAHYLWIEEVADGQAKVRFGHYEEGLREKSPGLIDKVPVPRAGSASGKPARAARLPDGFALDFGKKGGGTVWAAVEDAPVFDNSAQQKPSVRVKEYARWIADRSAKVAAPLALDIVPAGDAPNGFVVLSNGAPLPKAKVEVHAPNGWSRDYVTDDGGAVAIETPFPGLYVLETSAKEEVKGTFQGVAYDRTNSVASLSFDQP